MNLIAVLICLLLQKLLNIGGFSSEKLLGVYLKKGQHFFCKLNGYIALFLVVLPFLIVLSVIHILSLGHLFGLLHILFSVIVIFFCIDFRDIKSKAVKEIFIYAFEYIFAPLFWFIVLDVYGVAFYYLVANLRKTAVDVDPKYTGFVHAANVVWNILNWLPMRIVALSYALAGHFVTAFTYIYKKIISLSTDINIFVVHTGLASLEAEKQPQKSTASESRAAVSLVNRTLLIWIAALVLFTFGRLVA